MKIILSTCVHNTGRSQMAEAFFNRMTHGKSFSISAGTRLGFAQLIEELNIAELDE